MCKCALECIMALLMLPALIVSFLPVGLGVYLLLDFHSLNERITNSFVTDEADEAVKAAISYISDFTTRNLIIFSTVLIAVGLVMLTTAIIGLCGLCSKNACLLGAFSALTGLVGVGSLVVSIVFVLYPDALVMPATVYFKQTLGVDFDDLDNPSRHGNPFGVSAPTVALIKILQPLSCCGLTSYTDFQSSQSWNRTYSFSTEVVTKAQVPVMCCRNKQLIVKNHNGSDYSYYTPGDSRSPDTECLSHPTPENSYIGEPCMRKIFFNDMLMVTVWATFAVSVLLTIIFVTAVILTCCYSKKKKNKVAPEQREMKTIA